MRKVSFGTADPVPGEVIADRARPYADRPYGEKHGVDVIEKPISHSGAVRVERQADSVVA